MFIRIHLSVNVRRQAQSYGPLHASGRRADGAGAAPVRAEALVHRSSPFPAGLGHCQGSAGADLPPHRAERQLPPAAALFLAPPARCWAESGAKAAATVPAVLTGFPAQLRVFQLLDFCV